MTETQPHVTTRIHYGDTAWLSSFASGLNDAVRQVLQAWSEQMHLQAEQLEKAADSAAKRLQSVPSENADPAHERNVILQLLQRVETTAAQITAVSGLNLDTWDELWQDRLEPLPESVELIAPWGEWLRGAGGGARVTTWRQGQRLLGVFRKPAGLKQQEADRPSPDTSDDLESESPLSPVTPDQPATEAPSDPLISRTIPLRNLVAVLAEPPAAAVWTSARVRQLEFVTERIRDLRRLVLNLRGFGLLTDERTESSKPGSQDEAAVLVRDFATRLRALSDGYLRDEQSRFTTWIETEIPLVLQPWPWVGTGLYPAARFSEDNLERVRAAARSRMEARAAEPLKWLEGRRNNFAKDLRLASLLVQHANLAIGVEDRTRKRFSETVKEPFAKTTESVQRTWDTVKTAAEESPAVLRETMRSASDKLLIEMRYRRMPAAMQAVIEQGFEQMLDKYEANVESLLESLPPSETLYVESGPGGGKLHEIPFKDLLRRGAYLSFKNEFGQAEEWAKQRQGELVRGVGDLDDLLEVNISAGLDLLDKSEGEQPDPESVETALRGFGRLHGRMKELEDTVDELATEGAQRFREVAERFEKHLVELTDNQDLVRLRLEMYRAELRMQLVRRALWIAKRTGVGVRWLLTQAPRLLIWGRGEVERLRRLAGIAIEDRDAESRLAKFLQDTERIVAGLPFVYQQLFKIAPLVDDRFFTARERELEVFNGQVEAWRANRVASCSLVGEEGSGRTSLLKIARQTFLKDDPVIEFTLDSSVLDPDDLARRLGDALEHHDVHGFDDLEHRVLHSDHRAVVIVENLQHLFLRVVDGFEAIDRFLLFVSRTGEKLLWVLSCTWHSWQYLSRVLSVEGYVQRTIRLDSLSEEEVRAIIGRRHTVSGFKRHYVPTLADRKLRKYRKARTREEKQQVAEELFFQRLQAVAAGNVAVAMLFYLRAVQKVEGDRLYLTTDVSLDEAALATLTMDERFTLAAIVLHGGLTSDEHARVFRQEHDMSMRVLMRLKNKGLLITKEDDYRLHPSVHRPVLKALREANVLH